MTTMIEVIGVGPCSPSRLAPQPHWNTATRTPYATPIESTFIAAAFSGTRMDRKTSISSRNEISTTVPMNSGSVSAQLGVEVVGGGGDPGDVDVGGDHGPHLADRRRGLGIGRSGGRQRGEHRGAAVGGDDRRTDRGDVRGRGDRAGQRGQPGRVGPGPVEVDDHEQRRVDPGAEALLEQVVGLAVRRVGRRVAGGREGGLQPQRRERRRRPGRRSRRAGRARAGRPPGGRSATTRCRSRPSRADGAAGPGRCRSGRPAGRAPRAAG